MIKAVAKSGEMEEKIQRGKNVLKDGEVVERMEIVLKEEKVWW